jgi:anti-sigma regulatory factor (Ser/Thr protein kinase)
MHAERFRHEALLYEGDEDFLAATVPFVTASLDADQPIMVALPHPRLERLRTQLHDRAGDVRLVDMEVLGANPARIIPAWEDFVAEHADSGRRLRGIGEPIWAGRSGPQLAECQLHESLLNVAFADAPPFWLVCPYDTGALDAAVIAEARCSHPIVSAQISDRFRAVDTATVLDAPLPEPPPDAAAHRFDEVTLPTVRRFVRRRAAALEQDQLEGLLLAVTEAATNSVRHGGGSGLLRLWREDATLLTEVSDRGRIEEPLVGRLRPPITQEGGRGLWLANQLCDLVQIRSGEEGTVVRLHMPAPDRPPGFEPPAPATDPRADGERLNA